MAVKMIYVFFLKLHFQQLFYDRKMININIQLYSKTDAEQKRIAGLILLTLPRSNLFEWVSDFASCLSPVSPKSPNKVRKTLASVPAFFTSPVNTWTLYLRTVE